MVKKIIRITGLLAFCVAICWNVIVHDQVDTNPAQEIPLEDQKQRSELLQLLEEARHLYNGKGSAALRKCFKQTAEDAKFCKIAGLPDPVGESLALLEENGRHLNFSEIQIYVPDTPKNRIYHINAMLLPSEKKVRLTLLYEKGRYSLTRISDCSVYGILN